MCVRERVSGRGREGEGERKRARERRRGREGEGERRGRSRWHARTSYRNARDTEHRCGDKGIQRESARERERERREREPLTDVEEGGDKGVASHPDRQRDAGHQEVSEHKPDACHCGT